MVGTPILLGVWNVCRICKAALLSSATNAFFYFIHFFSQWYETCSFFIFTYILGVCVCVSANVCVIKWNVINNWSHLASTKFPLVIWQKWLAIFVSFFFPPPVTQWHKWKIFRVISVSHQSGIWLVIWCRVWLVTFPFMCLLGITALSKVSGVRKKTNSQLTSWLLFAYTVYSQLYGELSKMDRDWQRKEEMQWQWHQIHNSFPPKY